MACAAEHMGLTYGELGSRLVLPGGQPSPCWDNSVE